MQQNIFKILDLRISGFLIYVLKKCPKLKKKKQNIKTQ